ncbi:hypothetical protein ACJX0J_019093 [Zea mays]
MFLIFWSYKSGQQKLQFLHSPAYLSNSWCDNIIYEHKHELFALSFKDRKFNIGYDIYCESYHFRAPCRVHYKDASLTKLKEKSILFDIKVIIMLGFHSLYI